MAEVCSIWARIESALVGCWPDARRGAHTKVPTAKITSSGGTERGWWAPVMEGDLHRRDYRGSEFYYRARRRRRCPETPAAAPRILRVSLRHARRRGATQEHPRHQHAR